MADTRVGWQEIVTPDDLEAHMIAIGQAKANASLVDEMFAKLPAKTRIYVPGAGTGQIFDFMKSRWEKFEYLFADLRIDFLERIARRMPEKTKFTLAIDDVEDSKVDYAADVVLIVLVLEHVDWKKALREVAHAKNLMIVIQRNEDVGSAVVTKRKLRPSIEAFAKIAKSELVQEEDLKHELTTLGYKIKARAERSVPDHKTMISLWAERR